MQLTTAYLKLVLADAIATAKAFDPAATFVGLFTGITDGGANTAFADVTLAPGTFATALAVTTWGSAYLLNDGSAVVDGEPLVFAPGSAADNCLALGWYMSTLATAGVLKSYAYLPRPVNIVYGRNQLTIFPRLVVPNVTQYDATESWNG